MVVDRPEPLGENPPGTREEMRTRRVQNGSKVYSVSLNREWLRQLGLLEQGAETSHAMAERPVVIYQPAIIIQPADVVEPMGVSEDG
jgi:hypothetical protein